MTRSALHLPTPVRFDAEVSRSTEIASLCRAAAIVLLCGLLPLLAWVAFAPLGSAVVASAHVKVDLNRTPIQHAEGGVVREVHVRDGQRVKAGETLLVLGDVAVKADAQRLDYQVGAARVGIARLEAEERLAPGFAVPTVEARLAADDPHFAEIVNKERSLFAARKASLDSEKALLNTQREGLVEERKALLAQLAHATESLKSQRLELDSNRDLQQRGFISGARIGQLQASVADYGVKVEEKRADVARVDQRTAEIALRIASADNTFRQQSSDQLKLAVARLSDLEQEQRKSGDAASRQVISSPIDGEVMSLKFTNPGTVVAPRESIAEIVPVTPRLVIEASIQPSDVSRVAIGGDASVRFLAYKSASMPLVQGRVIYLSPDRLVDAATRSASYNVQIEVDPASLAAAGSPRVQAGMPAEVYITGERRTVLEYLLQPVTDVLRKGAREN